MGIAVGLVNLYLKGFVPLSHTPLPTVDTSECHLNLATNLNSHPVDSIRLFSRAAVYQPYHQHPIVNPISILICQVDGVMNIKHFEQPLLQQDFG